MRPPLLASTTAARAYAQDLGPGAHAYALDPALFENAESGALAYSSVDNPVEGDQHQDGQAEDILTGQGGSVCNILSVGLRLIALSQLDPDELAEVGSTVLESLEEFGYYTTITEDDIREFVDCLSAAASKYKVPEAA